MSAPAGGARRYYFPIKWLIGLVCALLLVGCGNEFRPVAIPIIPPGGTPQAQKQAVVLSDATSSGTAIPGSATNINVSGDTLFAVRTTGTNPVHAGLVANQARVLIANQDNTLSTYLTFATLTLGTTTTITLPAGSDPRFVHSREASNAYVALHGADPACGGANGSVGVISLTSLTLSRTICVGAGPIVGTGPIALAELPSTAKLYVANELSDNVTVINTADGSIAASIAVGTGPSWIDVSADGAFVYVANGGSNNVSVIDTASDTLRQNVQAGAGPSFLRFDPSRKRVYVTNSGAGANSITVIDADPASTTFLNPTDVPVGVTPVSVTALANNTKVYVANSGSNTVSVIDAATNTVTKTIDVGTLPISIESSPDSAQVFVANHGTPTVSGNVSVIRTSDDTKLSDLALPSPPGAPAGPPPPVVNPNFLVVTP
jgi:YVTN family beta-propeller protein